MCDDTSQKLRRIILLYYITFFDRTFANDKITSPQSISLMEIFPSSCADVFIEKEKTNEMYTIKFSIFRITFLTDTFSQPCFNYAKIISHQNECYKTIKDNYCKIQLY